MMFAAYYDENNTKSENNLNLNKIIDELSVLIMLNQVFTAKELCSQTIEEMHKSREFDSEISNLFFNECGEA